MGCGRQAGQADKLSQAGLSRLCVTDIHILRYTQIVLTISWQITNPERDLIASSSPSSWAGALLSVSPSDISHEQEVHHLDEQERRQVYLVQGGKGAGKSTFSKMLVNTLLNK